MPADDPAADLKAKLTRNGEDALGKLAQDLLDNPLINGAISAAFEARERASAAQEAAMGAFNIPSAADIERLTRRLRSVSQRIEGLEDAVDRMSDRIGKAGQNPAIDRIEEKLDAIAAELAELRGAKGAGAST